MGTGTTSVCTAWTAGVVLSLVRYDATGYGGKCSTACSGKRLAHLPDLRSEVMFDLLWLLSDTLDEFEIWLWWYFMAMPYVAVPA